MPRHVHFAPSLILCLGLRQAAACARGKHTTTLRALRLPRYVRLLLSPFLRLGLHAQAAATARGRVPPRLKPAAQIAEASEWLRRKVIGRRRQRVERVRVRGNTKVCCTSNKRIAAEGGCRSGHVLVTHDSNHLPLEPCALAPSAAPAAGPAVLPAALAAFASASAANHLCTAPKAPRNIRRHLRSSWPRAGSARVRACR